MSVGSRLVVFLAIYAVMSPRKMKYSCETKNTVCVRPGQTDIVSILPITIIVEQNVHQLKLSERFGLALLSRDAAYSRYDPGH